jgi:hypothetical protein
MTPGGRREIGTRPRRYVSVVQRFVFRPGGDGVNFSERAPSSEWEPLPHSGGEGAEAWFKPDGEPRTVVFRVPESRFQVEDITQQLTLEDLLTAAAVPAGDVDSWQFLDETHSGLDGTNLELKRLLPPPPPGETHLTVHVRLKPPAAGTAAGDQEIPPEKWQALDAVWKGILGLEAAIDALRLSMDGLRIEMESSFKKTLNVDEKVHCLQADVVQWTKAKNRVHYALPKLREFIHRATWAAAVAERKRMEEVVKTHIEPRVPPPDIDQVRDQLGHLQKDRQVLYAQGNAVNQEARAILSEIQRALSTLQRNAVDRARQKRSAGRDKGKHL